MPSPTHAWRLVPGADPSQVSLVLLHGSDGAAQDLVPLARRLAPGGTHLALQGTLRTPGGHAFFARHGDRSIDEDDLRARLPGLRDAITAGSAALPRRRPLAVGFSNGAIAAAALLMTSPDLLSGAVLLRPLTPFATSPRADLDGLPVLVVEGAHDMRRSTGDGLRCAQRLAAMGADVEHRVVPLGHDLAEDDDGVVAAWLDRRGLRP